MFSVVPSLLLQTPSTSSSSRRRRSSAARRREKSSSSTCFAAVRRVAVQQQQQQQSEFVPGSLLSRVVNLNKNTINWEALEKAVESLSGSDGGGGENGEDASGVFGLVRGELNVKTREELTERSFGYKEFVLLRTLGLKTYTLASCFRAKNVKTPVRKCSVGRVLADPGSKADGFYGLYARCSDALRGSGGEDDGGSALKFLDRVTERIETIAEEKLDEEFVSKTKNRYAKDVDESTFERAYGENAKKAVEFVFSSEDDDELILDVPNFDLPENIGSALAGGEVGALTAEDDDEPFAFGKKSKKKKKKAPAAASAISDAMKSVSGGQKSTLEALADLITTQAKKKKQQEPTFPEFANWGQSTAAEAMGILLTICLAIGEECVGNKNSRVILVLPSDLMLSALFFDRDPCVLGNQNENFCICASESAAKALLEEENTACDTTTLARIRIEGAAPSVSDEDLAALKLRGEERKKATRAKTLALRLK